MELRMYDRGIVRPKGVDAIQYLTVIFNASNVLEDVAVMRIF